MPQDLLGELAERSAKEVILFRIALQLRAASLGFPVVAYDAPVAYHAGSSADPSSPSFEMISPSEVTERGARVGGSGSAVHLSVTDRNVLAALTELGSGSAPVSLLELAEFAPLAQVQPPSSGRIPRYPVSSALPAPSAAFYPSPAALCAAIPPEISLPRVPAPAPDANAPAASAEPLAAGYSTAALDPCSMLALTAPAGARTPVSAVVAEACAAGGPVASLLHELAAHGAVGSLAWLLRALHTAVSATTPAPAEARARLRSLLEARDAAGRTPLAVAAAAGHTSVITLLLAPRAAAETDPASVPAAAADSVAAALPACIPVADVNAPDRCGLTPLLHAAWHGHAVAAAALVALGACADTVTPAAQTLATLTADDETRAAVTAALAARSERRRAVAAALASATQDVGVSNLVVAKIASFVE